MSKGLQFVSVDNDHTMMGFFDGAVPAWRESMPVLAAKLNISLEEAAGRLGKVFHDKKTHDYPWAVAVAFAPLWSGTVEEFVHEIEAPFWACQDKYRLEFVKPYPEVLPTLKQLKRHGVTVVCVSDAPFFMAQARLAGGGISDYIDAVYALDVVRDPQSVPSEQWLEFGDRRIIELEEQYSGYFKIARKLPDDYAKPDPRGIERAFADFGVTDASTAMHAGDSVEKDIGLGVTAGLGATLFTPWHAVSHLPTEYVNWITKVMIDRSSLAAQQSASIAAVPSVHGSFGEIINMLGLQHGEVHEVPDN
jgi:FMN phosphatase YigB (HAD superfamily)